MITGAGWSGGRAADRQISRLDAPRCRQQSIRVALIVFHGLGSCRPRVLGRPAARDAPSTGGLILLRCSGRTAAKHWVFTTPIGLRRDHERSEIIAGQVDDTLVVHFGTCCSVKSSRIPDSVRARPWRGGRRACDVMSVLFREASDRFSLPSIALRGIGRAVDSFSGRELWRRH